MKKIISFVLFSVLVFHVNAQKQIKHYYNNGQLESIGSYDKSTSDIGIKKGEWKTYYENGQLKSIGNHQRLGAYNYETKHDEWKFYYDNGQLSEISNYNFGYKKGESKTYYKNGQLKESVSYKSNSVLGRIKKIGAYKLYFENGKLNQTGNYADDYDWYSDVKIGEWRIYDENGQLSSFENFKDTYNHGEIKQYHLKGEVTDVDGNVYNSVKIGDQVWMGKNLNVSSFRNGDPIPQAKSKEAWDKAGDTQSPAWCYYENDSNNGIILGKLYNWHAVNDKRGLAPLGWHIPTDAEWTELTDNQGGKEKAAINMKSMIMWNAYENKREEGVFEALPGGIRLNGKFKYGGQKGANTYWWSATEERTSHAWHRGLTYYAEYVERRGRTRETGLSVRCVQDYTGERKEYYENGQLKKIGTTSNGIYIGEWKEYHENGQLNNVGKYSLGERTGEWTVYHENGQLSNVGKYSQGVMTGEWKLYHKNGKLRGVGNLENALQEGEWKYYYDNAQLNIIGNFEKGEKEDEWKYYHENGQLSSIGNYEGRYQKGEWKHYYENGQLSSIGNLEIKLNSKGIFGQWKTGEWKYYHVNGQIYKVMFYQVGKLMNILSCFDGDGNSLDKGTLVNGNGTINEYDMDGTLTKQVNYVNGIKK